MKINILERETLQQIRDAAYGMASGNLNPMWQQAYLNLAVAADHLDAASARSTIAPDGGWREESPSLAGQGISN